MLIRWNALAESRCRQTKYNAWSCLSCQRCENALTRKSREGAYVLLCFVSPANHGRCLALQYFSTLNLATPMRVGTMDLYRREVIDVSTLFRRRWILNDLWRSKRMDRQIAWRLSPELSRLACSRPSISLRSWPARCLAGSCLHQFMGQLQKCLGCSYTKPKSNCPVRHLHVRAIECSASAILRDEQFAKHPRASHHDGDPHGFRVFNRA